MSHEAVPREHDRRAFLMLLATAFTAVPAVVHAQAPPATAPASPPATPAPAAPPGPQHSTNQARLLTEVLRSPYPGRFGEEQWGSIAKDFHDDPARRGPLHGIPYGVKDLLATKGVPTTWGAEPYRNQVFDRDATVVRKLREAGAVLCAKLAMVELAGGMGYNHADASFTGPGLTPWNTSYWSGGSSSGPGASVAAGLVPFAIGSETSGSIVTPSAYSGVTGLRPTYGLVSRHGAMALCWTLDKLGPMGRTADDCALVLAAIAGPDPDDPTTSGRSFAWTAALKPTKPLRVAVPKGCTEKVQPAVRENFDAALA